MNKADPKTGKTSVKNLRMLLSNSQFRNGYFNTILKKALIFEDFLIKRSKIKMAK